MEANERKREWETGKGVHRSGDVDVLAVGRGRVTARLSSSLSARTQYGSAVRSAAQRATSGQANRRTAIARVSIYHRAPYSTQLSANRCQPVPILVSRSGMRAAQSSVAPDQIQSTRR